jgi:hypothetical protein
MYRIRKAVRIQGGESIPRAPEIPVRPIVDDICGFLASNAASTVCLQFELRENALVDTTNSTASESPVTVRQEGTKPERLLTQTLTTIRRTMAFHEKLKLATTLASSLLQLNQTPWLCQDWNTASIYIPTSANDSDIRAPYVVSELCEYTPSTPIQTIAGKHPDLVALGIVLMELSQNKSLREWYEAQSQKRMGDDNLNVLAKAEAAWKWYDEEVWPTMNWNEDYCDAIKLCFDARFLGNLPPQRQTLKDKGFREAFYNQIVYRLQKASDVSSQNMSLKLIS